jgi:undecaprenyl-diphosphatase
MLPGRQERWQRDPRTGLLVIVAGVGIVGFVALAAAILLAPAFVRFDMAASEAIRGLQLPGLEPLARVATRVGDFWPMMLLTALSAGWLWLRGRRTSAVTLALAVLLGTGVGAVLKLVFARVRPALEFARIPLPETYSFPSGHALSSLLFFGSVAFLVLLHEKGLRRAAVSVALCVLAALSIAFARVYLGVHYLGDVVGSWLLGAGLLALVVIVSARWGAGSSGDDVKPPDEAEA